RNSRSPEATGTPENDSANASAFRRRRRRYLASLLQWEKENGTIFRFVSSTRGPVVGRHDIRPRVSGRASTSDPSRKYRARMNIETETLDGGILQVKRAGRMDAPGLEEVDREFMEYACSQRSVIVDMHAVGFLASAGIRTLVLVAKAVS